MGRTKLLTLYDLYNYYSSKNENVTFSAIDDSESIVVQVDGKLNFNEDEKSSDYTEGLTPVVLQACHTLNNRNGSMISKENMEKCMPSFKNRPILGFIHDVDGQYEFYGHNMHQDDDGEIVYDEIPIGIIPESCDAKLVYDEEKGHEYVVVNGYLFDDYSKAVEILEREGECFVSVELQIRDLAYDAREKSLDIKDFFFSGVTILGKTPEGDIVQPGMDGSNIKLADFSQNNNSVVNKIDTEDANNKLVEALNRLNDNLEKININKAEFSADDYSKEGGNVEVSKFEELLAKYNKTEADVEFEIEGLSDEELEAKFEEVFGKESDEDPTSEEGEEADSEEKDADEADSDEEAEEETEDSDEPDEAESEETEAEETEEAETEETSEVTETEACGKKKKKCSISVDDEVRTFELSLDDIQYALYSLVNDMYAEADNTYYGVSVYESHVVMHDWWNGRNFKQSYARENDNFSLVGDRVEVYSNWLTKEEEAALDEMRANYAVLAQFKEDTENAQLHTQREAILNNEKYSVIAEKDENNEYKNEAYAKLVSEMDNYSLTDLEKELKSVFADYITNGGQFAYKTEEEKPVVNKKLFSTATTGKKTSRYGNLFNK